jgi:hypothetical protein
MTSGFFDDAIKEFDRAKKSPRQRAAQRRNKIENVANDGRCEPDTRKIAQAKLSLPPVVVRRRVRPDAMAWMRRMMVMEMGDWFARIARKMGNAEVANAILMDATKIAGPEGNEGKASVAKRKARPSSVPFQGSDIPASSWCAGGWCIHGEMRYKAKGQHYSSPMLVEGRFSKRSR